VNPAHKMDSEMKGVYEFIDINPNLMNLIDGLGLEL